MTTVDTLPKLLKRNYEKYGDKKIAMREKDYGIWQSFTWKDYYEKVKYFSLGLLSLGFKPGDKICILGDNKPEWIWAEVAAQAARGSAVGIFTDCVPAEVKYYLEDSESVVLVARDQEQTDKGLEVKDELPSLKKIVYWEEKGMWSYDDPILAGFDEVLELGREYEKAHPSLFEENVEKGNADDIAVLCYTSGTTGNPRGAMLSHRQVMTILQHVWELDHFSDNDNYICFLPPAWVTDQLTGVTSSLMTGMILNFPESPDTVQEDIREIGPNFLFYGPRLWESVIHTVQANYSDARWIERFLYKLFLPVAYNNADCSLGMGKHCGRCKVLHFLGRWLVYREILDKMGLSKIKVCYTAGAALSPDIIRFLIGIGVNIKQMYGLSECAIIARHRGGDILPETTGPVIKGMEVRISEQGEILLRGEHMYSGYYRKPEATAEKMRNGWFCTGDFGNIQDSGHLIVMDRMEDLRDLAGGRKFSPQYSEIRLRFSPYIRDALVMGQEDETDVVAVINIDFSNVGRWAEEHHIAYTTMTDLSQKPGVIKLIEGEIRKVNRVLPEWSRIKKFVNLHKDFDPDEAELTRTRKLRRSFVEDRYNALRETMYTGGQEFVTKSEIHYRDGRQGTITSHIKINTVEGEG
jgi:long-chain acyl-CoA synthetase